MKYEVKECFIEIPVEFVKDYVLDVTTKNMQYKKILRFTSLMKGQALSFLDQFFSLINCF